MNTINKSMLTACFFLTSVIANAQNENDALRYSIHNFGTTARSLSMGGAFGALGADFSSLSTNPAGIAFYRKGEFTFSPLFENRSADAKYIDRNTSDNRVSFGLGNVGLVWAYPKEKKKEGWKGVSFGIGYNRINSYNSRISFEGNNPDNSMTDYFAAIAQGQTSEQLELNYAFDADLAFQTYLINPVNDTNQNFTGVYTSALSGYGNKLQKSTISGKGAQGEIVISLGGNYDDKIYIGGTLGVPYIRYTENNIYEEVDNAANFNDVVDSIDGVSDFGSFKYVQDFTTVGTGINFKLGLIYRVNDYVRFGAAIHTPTYFQMSDSYKSKISSDFGTGSYSFESPDGNFSYTLTTPFKAIGSLAVLFKGQGLLSFDYEFMDYSSAHLSSNDYSFSDENRAASENFKYASNIRVGTEWKYKIFSFRGGCAMHSSPVDGKYDFKNGSGAAISYTGGFGFREKSFFLDLGYSLTQTSGMYRPYLLATEIVPASENKTNNHRMMMTLGFKF